MARKVYLIATIMLAAIAISCCSRPTASSISCAEQGFTRIPDSIRIGAYWYWISNNISSDGVVKDLQAMKEAGVTRAFIGNIGTDEVPYGKVNFMSDEWWDVTRTALRTASDLGIEIGLFNCPGWSQSGGPWISEEQSMRHVAFNETVIQGDGSTKTIPLPDVSPGMIISSYAYPTISGRREEWTGDEKAPIRMKMDKPMTVRSLLVYADDDIEGESCLMQGDRTIRTFYFDRSNGNLHVGFDPHAPQVISVPDIVGDDFTFKIDTRDKAGIRVVLTDVPLVEEYAEKTFAKMYQATLPPWDFYMWDTQRESDGARISTADMVNLDGCRTEDGKSLEWEAPDGRWTVVTAYMETTGVTNAPAVPEATGLEVDKMSKEHIRYHFDSFLGEILRKIPAEERKTLKVAVEDSYETGGQNWTDGMTEIFKGTYGYDPLPYLPAFQGYIVDNEDVTERFLWDVRRLVSDRVAYEYVGGLRDVCHENGLTSWLENYGHWGFPGEFLQYGGQSDEISGEFWAGCGLGGTEIRDASSCGHIYGKKKVWAESCTSSGLAYQRYPATLKGNIDNSFIEGINSTLLHLYIEQPDEVKPGINAWFGTEFNRHNTWFGYFNLFTDYLKRCNFLLQQGSYVADVAYFIGEDAPKMDGQQVPALPKGYSFDYINAEILKQHAHVEKGCLVLDSGMKYRVLVLPQQTTMRPEMLECLAGLVKDGLNVIGPQPVKSPSLAGWPDVDVQVRDMASRIWGSGKYGKGRIYPDGTTLDQVLSDLKVPQDCVLPGDSIRFIHRKLDDGEIYFVANFRKSRAEFDATFKDSGYEGAELWDAVTGSMEGVPVTREGGECRISLNLPSDGSVFVVFRNGSRPVTHFESTTCREIPGPWEVDFDAVCGNDAFHRTFPELLDWSVSDDEDVRYFSGSAHYRSDFRMEDLDECGKVTLDLGKVMVIAKVKVNGEYAGGVWTEPYMLDISNFVHNGDNTIEIDVANNWMNRLMGDTRKPASERHTWTYVNPAEKEDASLQESGLIGPVTVTSYR